jgi:uncharacterized membrane protein
MMLHTACTFCPQKDRLMLIAALILRYIHIVLGIAWFGGTVYRSLIVLPSVAPLTPEQRRPLLRLTLERHETILLTIGLAVVMLGILMGAVVGPIGNGLAITSAYGLTWLASMTLAFIILGWEGFAVSPAIGALAPTDDDASEEDVPAPPGSPRRAQTLAWIEIGGFCVLVSFMVLMHFGY